MSMSQIYALQNDKSWKTAYVDDTIIRLVNERYKTTEEFNEKYEAKGFLKSRLEISILDITAVAHKESDASSVTITYSGKKEDMQQAFEFAGSDERDEFIRTVIKPRNLQLQSGKMPWHKAIGPSVLGLFLVIVFGAITYFDAKALEAGEEVDVSGRRSLYKRLFAWLAELLGTTGSIAVFGGLALVCCYFIYKNIKTPPNMVIYS